MPPHRSPSSTLAEAVGRAWRSHLLAATVASLQDLTPVVELCGIFDNPFKLQMLAAIAYLFLARREALSIC
jgi:hypothetical protein